MKRDEFKCRTEGHALSKDLAPVSPPDEGANCHARVKKEERTPGNSDADPFQPFTARHRQRSATLYAEESAAERCRSDGKLPSLLRPSRSS